MAGLHESSPQTQPGGAAEALSQLGHDLCEEAERRARRLLEAALHWQARYDETNKTASPVRSSSVEETTPAPQRQPSRFFSASVFLLPVLVSLLLLSPVVWQKGVRELKQHDSPSPRTPPVIQEPSPPTAPEIPPPFVAPPQKPEPPPSLTPAPPSTIEPSEPPITTSALPPPALTPPAEREVSQTLSAPIPPPPSELSQTPQPLQPESDATAQPTHQLTIEAKEPTWIRATIDEKKIKDILLQPGERIEWLAQRQFTLTVGNAGGVDLMLDGQQLPPLGRSGQVIRNLRLPSLSPQQGGRTARTAEP